MTDCYAIFPATKGHKRTPEGTHIKMDDLMKKDWVECALGEIFFTTSGGTPSRKNKTYYGGSIPWVKSGELDKGLILDTEEKITEEAIKSSSAKKFPAGTLLIALYGATIGKTAFLGVEAATNQAICGIFKNGHFNSKFLYNYLLFRKPRLISQGSGGAQPNISQTILKKLKIPLAPLPEQRAIVAKIEGLFSDLDKGIADLKKAQAQLKTYRQAVLKKAFEGEWEEKQFGDIAEIKRGKSKHRPRNDKRLFGGKNPFIQTGDVKAANGGTIKHFSQTYSDFGLAQSKLWPKGTLCLTIAANIADTAFLGFDACFPDSVVGVLPCPEILSAEFINYYICMLKKKIDGEASATAQKNINVRILEAMKIPVPPLEEQHQIVREIESRLSVCDEVEGAIVQSLGKAEALRQSILKKAFEGRLLSEAELADCRAEPDYEPASELLKRIKAERD